MASTSAATTTTVSSAALPTPWILLLLVRAPSVIGSWVAYSMTNIPFLISVGMCFAI